MLQGSLCFKSKNLPNPLMNKESVDLNLIVKPGQTTTLFFSKPFFDKEISFDVNETDTALNVKERISTLSGIPVVLIVIFIEKTFNKQFVLPEETQIWETMAGANVIKIAKRVFIELKTEDETRFIDYLIIEEEMDTATIKTLRQFMEKEHSNRFKFESEQDLTLQTKLIDVGERKVQFKTKNRKCTLS